MMDNNNNLLTRLLRACLEKRLVMGLLLFGLCSWGIAVSPFDFDVPGLPRSPVPVDAIPDLGENQQIVFTEWPGRSPQDVEDQITYPLTVALLGVPGVKTIRSQSYFGFSSIYVIFEEDVEFYWSRSRVLEQLSSLKAGTLPEETEPRLGPDATALGQVFWYTLEGRDADGNPTGGWGLEELRSIQDWQVRYALLAAQGVSEVASIGGFVEEYQIDVDPDAMRAYNITLGQVFAATRLSNLDVGARTIEVSGVEYVIRGLGFIERIEDIEQIVVAASDNVPIRIRDVAKVVKGPALRRGVLDKAGIEAVGGVVVVRQGFNPLEAIENTKDKIKEISPGLPAKTLVDFRKTSLDELESFANSSGFEGFQASKLDQAAWTTWLRAHPREFWPQGVTLSQLAIVPFYDRTGLIEETLGTLSQVLGLEVLITILVIVFMLRHLGSSLVVSALLPVAVLMTFIAMRLFGVTANLVALSGIAIAIGTLVDLGVIISENIRRHLDEAGPEAEVTEVVLRATREVAGAVLTSVATTVVSFLPVFTLTGAEGKLFTPLAFTKTSALLAALLIALALVPLGTRLLSSRGLPVHARFARVLQYIPDRLQQSTPWLLRGMVVLSVAILLANAWRPLGIDRGIVVNLVFVALLVGGLLLAFRAYLRVYPIVLEYCLDRKLLFMALPVALSLWGLTAYVGFDQLFRFAPEGVRQTAAWQAVDRALPGLGSEFMPSLDEGSYLYMPTTMPHASIGEAHEMLQMLDSAIASIPEVETVVGKLGRADTPLDPAPISMFEILVNYVPEYRSDAEGRPMKFAFDEVRDKFRRNGAGELVEDARGRPYRQWRAHIETADDLWQEIVRVADLPGTTSAPKLQPIAARIVMLQSGMRSPMGIKIKGPSLEAIEEVSLEVESALKEVPGIRPDTVLADRLIGKPYLEIDLDREALARYGLGIADVQQVIEVAIGGKPITNTIEGRERYSVRVRYLRELRDTPESLSEILVPTASGAQVPLGQLAEVIYTSGPQSIKSEDTFLVGYVLFDKVAQRAEVDVVREAKALLDARIESGELIVPAGVSLSFAGSYENQVRAIERLSIIVPVSLLVIFAILYLQFSSVATSLIVFSGIAIAWAGGFILIWCYSLQGFLDFSILGANLRDLFQIGPVNMSVAVWVGFLALFGIATDNGVVTATYLDQSLAREQPNSILEVRHAVVEGATRRIRPALMTTATTLIALLPLLSSQGRGSDIMVPMAIPSFGGMLIAVVSTLVVPVLYSAAKEYGLAGKATVDQDSSA